MNDEGFGGFLVGLGVGILLATFVTIGACFDTSGVVTKVIPLNDTTDIIVIENKYSTQEVFSAPKSMITEGTKYSDINLDINYRVEALTIDE